MKVYTYSEARQHLARVLEEANSYGEIRIRRRDGTEYALRPVNRPSSPLDVEGVDCKVSKEEIMQAIREGREKE